MPFYGPAAVSHVAAVVTEVEREMNIHVKVDRTASNIAARSCWLRTECSLMRAVGRRAGVIWRRLAVDFVRLRTTGGRA